MSTILTKFPPPSCYHSGKLDNFKPTLYFTTDCPVGQPMIRSSRPRSTTLEQLFRDDKRSKLGSKLASFVKSIFHRTKCKPKSTNIISKVPKPHKTRAPLCPKIPRELLGNYDSCRKGIEVPCLVHQDKYSQKTNTVFNEFAEYREVLYKGANEVLLSTNGMMNFIKNGDQLELDNGYCDERESVCSSDLFELENYIF